MSEKELKINYKFVQENREEFLLEYANKFLLISEGKIISTFDTYEKAAEEGVRLFGLDGNFLVHFLSESDPVNFIMEAI